MQSIAQHIAQHSMAQHSHGTEAKHVAQHSTGQLQQTCCLNSMGSILYTASMVTRPVCANSSCTTAKLVSCLVAFLCDMTLVGTPVRPEVLAAAPASMRDAWSGLPCMHQIT